MERGGQVDVTLEDVVARAVGIYGTAPTCYLSCLARRPDFELEDWDRAIADARSLVRVRAMRYSVYTFPHDLLGIALAATRAETARAMERQRKYVGEGYEAVAERVEEALEDGPLPSAELRERADPERELGSRFSGVLAHMAGERRIVRATTTGGWRSNRHTYALWERWVPDVDPLAVDGTEARRRLAERYAGAYGPVTLEDVAWWAGWTKTVAAEATEGVDLEREGEAWRDLEGLKLLPVWDVLMVAYRDRSRLFDEAHGRFLYDSRGNATSVVLDGGRAVGVWDLGKSDDPLSVRVAPLESWPGSRWEAVEEEVGRIGRAIGASEVEILRESGPVDLEAAPRNRFLSPLSSD